MLRIFILFLFFSISWSQSLPREYVLLIRFLNTKDKEIGNIILREYPKAVFINDLKLLLAQEYYRSGDHNQARNLLLDVDPKRLKHDLRDAYKRLWLSLSLDEKEAFLKDPVLFREFAKKARLKSEEAKRVSEELFRKRQYSLIRDLWINNPYPETCSVYGASLYHMKENQKAIDVLRECPDDNLKVEYLARAYHRDGNYEMLSSLVESFPYVGVLIGKLYLFSGDYERSAEFLKKAQNSYEKFFYLGLVHYILGDYENAISYFRESKSYSKSPSEESKSNFWISKSYSSIGINSLSVKYMVESSRGEGFYSLMARAYLKEPLVHRGFKRVLGETFPKEANVIKAIHDAGFVHYARLEAFARIEHISPSDIASIVNFDPFLGIRLALRKYSASSDIYNAVAFPKPFSSQVLKISQEYGVDPNLVWAVMRQESLFDVYAVSVSNAKGLMQLIDSTARWVANKEGINLIDVYDVETNIRLGTAYLKYLMDFWNGDMVRVIASYNAGENRVKGFIQYKDPYVFIETIPISETRNYLQRVLYNYYIYSSYN